MTINMTIRTETTADHNAIETLTYGAFENHPHHAPGAKPTEHLIINKLRDAGVVLLGEPEYYGRFGFETHANLTLEGVPPEYFMIKSLCDDDCTTTDNATADKAIPVGEVTYHAAFR